MANTVIVAIHSLVNVSGGRFHQACLDQTDLSCCLLPPHKPLKTGHQKSHNDDAITGCHAQLIWALSIILHCRQTGSSG